MGERRYSEEEIAAIFKRAAEEQDSAHGDSSHGEGLTLAELQEIGKEAGLAPEFVVRAASSVGQTVHPSLPKTMIGIPVGVERSADIVGTLTDEAWERLVGDLRETFRASGVVKEFGSVRQWRNGNLYAYAEPQGASYRLRLGTENGNGKSQIIIGIGSTVFMLALLAFLAISGEFGLNPETMIFSVFTLFSMSLIGISAASLPRWAQTRQQQMEAIIGRAIKHSARNVENVLPEPTISGRLDLDDLTDERDESVSKERGKSKA